MEIVWRPPSIVFSKVIQKSTMIRQASAAKLQTISKSSSLLVDLLYYNIGYNLSSRLLHDARESARILIY